MSHDQVELRRFISTTSAGSVSTAMSGSGSFAGDSIHHHTDADASTNPVYSSIPESQMAHQQFVARQQSPPSQVPQPSNHTHISHTESNQYDSIPDKHKARVIDSVPNKPSGGAPEKQGVGVPGSVAGSTGMLQAENALYTGLDEANEMRHKTLTMNNTETFKRFREERSPETKFNEDRNECRTCALLLWGGCVTGLVVLALAGAAVALAIIFTGFVDVCANSCPNQASASDASTQSLVQSLQDRINELELRLNESVLTPVTSTTSGSTQTSPTMVNDVTTPTAPVMTATPPPPMMEDVSITLSNVSLFSDCFTSIETRCTIETGETQCTTTFGHSYRRPGEFIMDISCVRETPDMSDQNGLSWVLSIDSTNNAVECLCYVVSLVQGSGTRRPETCGLRVTRCSAFSNITSSATITSST